MSDMNENEEIVDDIGSTNTNLNKIHNVNNNVFNLNISDLNNFQKRTIPTTSSSRFDELGQKAYQGLLEEGCRPKLANILVENDIHSIDDLFSFDYKDCEALVTDLEMKIVQKNQYTNLVLARHPKRPLQKNLSTQEIPKHGSKKTNLAGFNVEKSDPEIKTMKKLYVPVVPPTNVVSAACAVVPNQNLKCHSNAGELSDIATKDELPNIVSKAMMDMQAKLSQDQLAALSSMKSEIMETKKEPQKQIQNQKELITTNHQKKFFDACRSGNVSELRKLLSDDKGVRISLCKNAAGESGICVAAYKGHVDCIRVLHELGADVTTPTKYGATPAFVAAENGHVDCIRVLHELGADLTTPAKYGHTPVYTAARNGHVDCIRVLYELGADLTTPTNYGYTPVHIAAENGHVDCIRVLHELGADLTTPTNGGNTPVYNASRNGHVDCIRVLHELGADVTTPTNVGKTPVHIAAENGHVDCIRVLHELGADVTTPTNVGNTPVNIAAENEHVDCIRLLHELGADLTTPDNYGYTPVYNASRNGHVDCIRVLHELGADVTTPTNVGKTPVHIAAENGHVDCIRVLHELGADLTTPTNGGETPVDVARKKLQSKCVKFLKDHM